MGADASTSCAASRWPKLEAWLADIRADWQGHTRLTPADPDYYEHPDRFANRRRAAPCANAPPATATAIPTACRAGRTSNSNVRQTISDSRVASTLASAQGHGAGSKASSAAATGVVAGLDRRPDRHPRARFRLTSSAGTAVSSRV